MTSYNYKILMMLSIAMLFRFELAAIFQMDSLERRTIFNSFHRSESINITLEMDLSKLIENKNSNTAQHARMSYTNNNGKTVEREIRIKARGKYRRKICDIPPMRLEFSKKELTAEGFKEYNKLKLVTHCHEENIKESEQNTLKEFLIYKMLNILSEKSYKVQLVNITYIDKKNHHRMERLGFIIESTSELGERLEGTSELLFGLKAKNLETSQYQMVCMFQYMISNTDWETLSHRNVKTFSFENTDKIIVVPYDFDFSGFVNAPYAVVNSNLPVSNLRERFFQGQFENEEELNKALDLFRDKEKEIMEFCENFRELSKKNRRDISRFIKSFYRTIEDKSMRESEFLKIN